MLGVGKAAPAQCSAAAGGVFRRSCPEKGRGRRCPLEGRQRREGARSVGEGGRRGTAAFLAVQAVLYVLFLSMDLLEAGGWSDPVKFLSILLCLGFCLFWAGRGGDRLVAAAMVFTAAADLLLLLLDRWYGAGVALFCVVQGLYLARIRRMTGRGLWLPLRAGLSLLLWMALVRLGLFTPLNALAAFYFANFLCNAAAALGAPGRRGRLFALGLWLFLCCDVCVGLRNSGLPLGTADAVQLGMWFFYLPGQVLIALSALPDPGLRGVCHETK